MKSFVQIKRVALFALLTLFAFSMSAQRHYKHPRVKVKAGSVIQVKGEETNVKKVEITPVVVTESIVKAEAVTNEPSIESTVASKDAVIVAAPVSKKLSKNKVNTVTTKKADIGSFIEKLKKHEKIFDVKDVKKTAIETWLMLMIIMLAAGVLFIILAIVFLFALFSGIYLLFWILAALCFTAAAVFLILGLTGVM